MSTAPVKALFAAPDAYWPRWEPALRAAFDAGGLAVDLTRDPGAVDCDYIVYAPGGPVRDFSPYVRAKAVQSLWAGVETIVGTPSLRHPRPLPLCRMVDPGLRQGMVEWVAGHVLRHHLGLDVHVRRTDPVWAPAPPPLASGRPVTVLGMGELGQAVATALQALGFPVTGWSRQRREVPGVRTLGGLQALPDALGQAQIVVLLLPLTPDTSGLIDAVRLAQMPKGAVLLNPGRGALIDDAALIAALEAGHIGHATLDTFRTEPLPPDHPFWHHPRVTVTPHVAAETRPESASHVVAETIRRGEAGLPFRHLVDLDRGY